MKRRNYGLSIPIGVLTTPTGLMSFQITLIIWNQSLGVRLMSRFLASANNVSSMEMVFMILLGSLMRAGYVETSGQLLGDLARRLIESCTPLMGRDDIHAIVRNYDDNDYDSLHALQRSLWCGLQELIGTEREQDMRIDWSRPELKERLNLLGALKRMHVTITIGTYAAYERFLSRERILQKYSVTPVPPGDLQENGPDECMYSICGVPFGEKSEGLTPCNHVFGSLCLAKWLTTFSQLSDCPLCRAVFPVQEVKVEAPHWMQLFRELNRLIIGF